MNTLTTTHARSLLDAPLRLENPAASLGRAIWLYLALLLHANDQGLVIRKGRELARDLSVPEPVIEAWLSRLVEAKLVEILSPLPFLTVRLPFWSADVSFVEENAVLSSEETENSNSKQSSAVAISLFRNATAGEGGQGEGDLKAAIKAMLPDAEDAEVERILDRYPRTTIRKAVERVNKAGRIRKSKTALFRFLLGKFSEEIDVRDL